MHRLLVPLFVSLLAASGAAAQLEHPQPPAPNVVLFLVDDGPSPGVDLSYSNRRMNAEERAERLRGFERVLRGGKASIWEGGQVSPCYVRWPGVIPAGRDLDVPSHVADIYPTLAAATGAEFPEGQLPLDGRNLLPALLGEPTDWSDRMLFDLTNLYLKEFDFETEGAPRIRELSVHVGPFKYVRHDPYFYNGDPDAVWESLHHLEDDPRETENLAAAMRERWRLRLTEPGRHSLNLVVEDRAGARHTARVDAVVR